MPRIELSELAYVTLCGLIQPEWEVNTEGIFSDAFTELRQKFPLADFQAAVANQPVDPDPDTAPFYYDPDAGM